MKEIILIVLLGIAYLFLGLQFMNYSPLIVHENSMYFGMIFDLLHYSITAIPISILICMFSNNISPVKTIVLLFTSCLIFGVFTGGIFSVLPSVNSFIYIMWLFSFIFIAQAFNKSFRARDALKRAP